MIFFSMDSSTSAHVGSAGRHKSKQQNVQGNQENTGSQGALAAVLAAVRESSAKQAEGLTRLEERLKTLETKQEASCEKLAKKRKSRTVSSAKATKSNTSSMRKSKRLSKQQRKHFPRRIFGIRTKLQQPKRPLTKVLSCWNADKS